VIKGVCDHSVDRGVVTDIAPGSGTVLEAPECCRHLVVVGWQGEVIGYRRLEEKEYALFWSQPRVLRRTE
jgi:hypothetical protein